MSQTDKQIGEEIREIADKYKGKLRFPVMSGKIISVDDVAMTCVVERSVDDEGVSVDGVNINVVLNNTGGMYMVPADGAYCLVAEVDGPDKWEMLKAGAYTKIVVQAADLIQMNDGSLGGLTKTLELQTQINKLNAKVEHLCGVINGAPIPEPGSGANSALQVALQAAIAADEVADFSAIENVKIKQG